MEAKWIDERRVSELTGIAVQTLRNWRMLGRGFPYSKVGRSIRYSIIDVQQYMEEAKVKTEQA